MFQEMMRAIRRWQRYRRARKLVGFLVTTPEGRGVALGGFKRLKPGGMNVRLENGKIRNFWVEDLEKV